MGRCHGLPIQRASAREDGVFSSPLARSPSWDLLLRAGRWNDWQVLPTEYAGTSTADAVATRGSDADGLGYRWPGYGYYWRRYPGHGPEAAFAAIGYGGQLILVWPNNDAVCVVTTNGSDDGWSARRRLSGMVLPAVMAKTLA
jgi:CubicO group peptidase (beta-lactamase class C family)